MPDVVVVIGSGGMGRAIARRQGAGRKLVLADCDETTLQTAARDLADEGYDVAAVPVDISSRASVRQLAQAAADMGHVVQMVHTAGVSPARAPVDTILRVDLLGTALILEELRAVIGAGGAGVVIASMAGHIVPFPDDVETALATTPADELLALPALQSDQLPHAGLAYALAKRGNIVRVRAAAKAWGVRGARINSISPGIISTAMGREELDGDSGAVMRSMIAGSATGRIGTSHDIAEGAAFLLSPAASFITGTDLLMDGGVTCTLHYGQGRVD